MSPESSVCGTENRAADTSSCAVSASSCAAAAVSCVVSGVLSSVMVLLGAAVSVPVKSMGMLFTRIAMAQQAARGTSTFTQGDRRFF